LLFNVLAQGTDGDVRTDLEKLLDQSTPLYKARFESLPPQAQQIVDAVAIHWDPISAGELAEKLPLDVNQVSSQLNRLVQQGVLEKVEYHPATKAGFQVAERFFNIWYLMRASRRVRRRLLWLVQFLRLFYGADRLKSKARDLLLAVDRTSQTERMRHAEFCLAVAEVLEDDRPTRAALESHAIRTLLSDPLLSIQLDAMLDLDGADSTLKPVVNRERWLADFNAEVNRLPVNAKQREEIADLIGGAVGRTRAQRTARVRELSTIKPRQRLAELKRFKVERTRLLEQYGTSLGGWTARALREGFMDDLFDDQGIREAIVAYQRPELAAPRIVLQTPSAFDEIDRLALLSDDPFVIALYAVSLAERGRTDEAQKVIAAVPKEKRFANFYFAEGVIFSAVDKFEQAITSFRQAASRSPQSSVARHQLAVALVRAQRIDESFDVFDEALRLRRDVAILYDYGHALTDSGRHERAEALLREVLDRNPIHQRALTDLSMILLLGGRVDEAEKLADSISKEDASPGLRIAQAATYLIAKNLTKVSAIVREAIASGGVRSAVQYLPLLFLADAIDDALALLRQLVSEWPAEATRSETVFFAFGVIAGARRGAAENIAEILADLDLEDRFRPLVESITIIAKGDRRLLKRLAPELQQPVRELLDLLPAVTAVTTPKKSKRTRRKR